MSLIRFLKQMTHRYIVPAIVLGMSVFNGAQAAVVSIKLPTDSQFANANTFPVCSEFLDYLTVNPYAMTSPNSTNLRFQTKKAYITSASMQYGQIITGNSQVDLIKLYEDHGWEVIGVLIYRENWLAGDSKRMFDEDARILSQAEISDIRAKVRASNLRCKNTVKFVQLLGGNNDKLKVNFDQFRASTKQFLKDNFDGVSYEVHIKDEKIRPKYLPTMANILKWDKDNGKVGFIFMGGLTTSYQDYPAMVATYNELWAEMAKYGISKNEDYLIYHRQGARPMDGAYAPETKDTTLMYQMSWLINAVSKRPGANQTPTVKIAASANPAHVKTGKMTTLSVLGADADPTGESNLSYKWSVTGPAGVTFSKNNTNAAKNVTATFTKDGAYHFQVKITDIGDRSATSSTGALAVEVVVGNQPLPSVTIAASTAQASEPARDGQFTITRSGPTTDSLAVTLGVGGTAVNGTDYSTIPTTLTIPAGSATKTIAVKVNDDAIDEVNETVVMRIAANPAYTMGTQATATVTIADNDAPPVAFQTAINFQPANTPTVPGWNVDSGKLFGVRSNGLSYGWSEDMTFAVRDRNASNSPNQVRDTLICMQKLQAPDAQWRIAVPNGKYSVRLVVGDPIFIRGRYVLTVEGKVAVDFTPTDTLPWTDPTVDVTVSDGRLTIAHGPGSEYAKICGVEIQQIIPVSN